MLADIWLMCTTSKALSTMMSFLKAADVQLLEEDAPDHDLDPDVAVGEEAARDLAGAGTEQRRGIDVGLGCGRADLLGIEEEQVLDRRVNPVDGMNAGRWRCSSSGEASGPG
jgi:hypothetical protein